MSYRTKSALAAVLALGGVYGAYFVWASQPGRGAPDILAHMIGAVILLTAVMIGLEVAIAVHDRAWAKSGGAIDERDRLNGLRGARNGYYALVGFVALAPFVALAGAPPVLMANLCLGVLVAAEIIHFGSRVVYDLMDA